MVKTCSTCKVDKSLLEFSNNLSRKDGKQRRCKNCASLHSKLWRHNNKDKVRAASLKHYYKNKEIHWERNRDYRNKRRQNDLHFKLACNIRSRLGAAIKNNWKSGSAVKDLGCSIEQLKKHLESQFQPGMTWNNWATDGWHIDHIVPLSSFNLENKEELKKACHYSNLQPLWAEDNLIKGHKIEQ